MPQWEVVRGRLNELRDKALSDMLRAAKENDSASGYHAGQYDAYMKAMNIPDETIIDFEVSIKEDEVSHQQS